MCPLKKMQNGTIQRLKWKYFRGAWEFRLENHNNGGISSPNIWELILKDSEILNYIRILQVKCWFLNQTRMSEHSDVFSFMLSGVQIDT